MILFIDFDYILMKTYYTIRSLGVCLSLSNSISPLFIVYAIWNFIGLVQYTTICPKMSPENYCVHLFFQD